MKQTNKMYLTIALALSTCGVLFQNCAAAPPPDLAQLSEGGYSSVTPDSQTIAVPGSTPSPTPVPAFNCSFNGAVVLHGSSVTAYQSSSVPSGSSCASQQRTCNNGFLSGTYQYTTCAPLSPSGTASCSLGGKTILHGGSITAYLASSVPFGSSCSSEPRYCSNGYLSGSYTYLSCSPQAAKSCTFNGRIIAHGASVQAFYSQYAKICSSQMRKCYDGVLDGTYQYDACEEYTLDEPYVKDGTQIQ